MKNKKSSNPQSILRSPEFYILLILSIILLFWNLHKGTLADWDELLYTSVAKDLALTGSAGNLLYKPPLFYYMLALSYSVFGISTFTSRMIPALFGVGCVVLTYLLGRKLFSRSAGIIAALVLLTSPEFVLYSRLAVKDVPLLFFILLSFYWFTKALGLHQHALYNQKLMLVLGIVAVLLGAATKHLAGLYPLIVFGIYCLFHERDFLRRNTRTILSLLFFMLCIIIFWLLLQVFLHKPSLLTYLYFHLTGAVEGHAYGWNYYFTVLQKGFYPWIFLLPLGVIYGILIQIQKNNSREKKIIHLLLTAIAVVAFALLLYQTQLPWYLLPAYPFLALLIGMSVQLSLFHLPARYILLLIFLVVFVVAFYFPPILNCNPLVGELPKLIPPDDDNAPELIMHQSINYELVNFYFNYTRTFTTKQAISKFGFKWSKYLLVDGISPLQLKSYIEGNSTIKDKIKIVVGERTRLLITDDPTPILFNLPPEDTTIRHCYAYFPPWLDYPAYDTRPSLSPNAFAKRIQ